MKAAICRVVCKLSHYNQLLVFKFNFHCLEYKYFRASSPPPPGLLEVLSNVFVVQPLEWNC